MDKLCRVQVELRLRYPFTLFGSVFTGYSERSSIGSMLHVYLMLGQTDGASVISAVSALISSVETVVGAGVVFFLGVAVAKWIRKAKA